jgi:hypothetical protein
MKIEFSSRRQRRERLGVLFRMHGPQALFQESGPAIENIVDSFQLVIDRIIQNLGVPPTAFVGTPNFGPSRITEAAFQAHWLARQMRECTVPIG